MGKDNADYIVRRWWIPAFGAIVFEAIALLVVYCFLMAVSGEGPPWEWRGQTVGFAIAFAYLFVFPVWIVISVITISAFWIWSGFKQKTSRKDDTEQTN